MSYNEASRGFVWSRSKGGRLWSLRRRGQHVVEDAHEAGQTSGDVAEEHRVPPQPRFPCPNCVRVHVAQPAVSPAFATAARATRKGGRSSVATRPQGPFDSRWRHVVPAGAWSRE